MSLQLAEKYSQCCASILTDFVCIYQVLGHVKTVLVLLGGWLIFGDRITLLQILGIAVAVSGMVLYGKFTR